MAQRAQAEVFRRAGHVDLVCGTRQFQHLPAHGGGGPRAARTGTTWRPPSVRLLAVDMDAAVAVERAGEEYAGGLHGYLAVMRGCDLNCTYCIVPT